MRAHVCLSAYEQGGSPSCNRSSYSSLSQLASQAQNCDLCHAMTARDQVKLIRWSNQTLLDGDLSSNNLARSSPAICSNQCSNTSTCTTQNKMSYFWTVLMFCSLFQWALNCQQLDLLKKIYSFHGFTWQFSYFVHCFNECSNTSTYPTQNIVFMFLVDIYVYFDSFHCFSRIFFVMRYKFWRHAHADLIHEHKCS